MHLRLVLAGFEDHPLRQRLNLEFHAGPPVPLPGATLVTHLAFQHEEEPARDEREVLVDLCKGLACTAVDHADSCPSRPRHSGCAGNVTPSSPATPFPRAGRRRSARCGRDGPGCAASRLDAADSRPANPLFSHRSRKFAQGEDGRACAARAARLAERPAAAPPGRNVAPRARREGESGRACAACGAPARAGGGCAAAPGGGMVIPLRRRATKPSAQRTSEGRTTFRFGAAQAYQGMVMQRIEELRESRISGFPTFAEFMQRRLLPGMRTCAAIARRQEELSARVARNSQLLRTRVDIELERQNQELLGQMNQRARLQLRLQQTVEGLSVVVLTYYGSQLVHDLAAASRELHQRPVEAITAASIPLIALLVAWTTRRMRSKLAAEI